MGEHGNAVQFVRGKTPLIHRVTQCLDHGVSAVAARVQLVLVVFKNPSLWGRLEPSRLGVRAIRVRGNKALGAGYAVLARDKAALRKVRRFHSVGGGDAGVEWLPHRPKLRLEA